MLAWNEGSARGTPMPPVPFSPLQAAQLRAYSLAPFRSAWACEQPNPPSRINVNRRSSMSVSLRSIRIHEYLNIYSKPVNPQNKPVSRDGLPGHAKICTAGARHRAACLSAIAVSIGFAKPGSHAKPQPTNTTKHHTTQRTHNDERTDQLVAPR